MKSIARNAGWLRAREFRHEMVGQMGRIFAQESAMIADDSEQLFFKNASWALALVPDGILPYSRSLQFPRKEEDESFVIARETLYPALDRCVQKLNAPPLVLTSWGMGAEDDHKDGGLLLPSTILRDAYRGFVEAGDSDGIMISSLFSLLFDQSAKWGLIGGPDGFSILGGEAAFMLDFYHECGGKHVLRDVFELLADEEDYFDIRSNYSTVRDSLA